MLYSNFIKDSQEGTLTSTLYKKTIITKQFVNLSWKLKKNDTLIEKLLFDLIGYFERKILVTGIGSSFISFEYKDFEIRLNFDQKEKLTDLIVMKDAYIKGERLNPLIYNPENKSYLSNFQIAFQKQYNPKIEINGLSIDKIIKDVTDLEKEFNSIKLK